MHASVHYVACKWRYAPFVMLILNKIKCTAQTTRNVTVLQGSNSFQCVTVC